MGKIDLQIQTMAHELGDDFGFEDSTVEYIASELQLSEDEVRAVLASDYYPERDGHP